MTNEQRITKTIERLIVKFHPISLTTIHFACVALDPTVELYSLPHDCVQWKFSDGSKFETEITDEDEGREITRIKELAK